MSQRRLPNENEELSNAHPIVNFQFLVEPTNKKCINSRTDLLICHFKAISMQIFTTRTHFGTLGVVYLTWKSRVGLTFLLNGFVFMKLFFKEKMRGLASDLWLLLSRPTPEDDLDISEMLAGMEC